MDKHILVVNFDAEDLSSIEQSLQHNGMIPIRARNRQEVVESCSEKDVGAVLLAVDGVDRHREIVATLRSNTHRQVPILFFGTGEEGTSIRAPSEALAEGGDYFFRLPCDLSYLSGRVRAWAERGARFAPVEEAEKPRESSPESPELEGLSYREEGIRNPVLEQLRGRPRSPSTLPRDWEWADALIEDEPIVPDTLDPLENLRIDEVSLDTSPPKGPRIKDGENIEVEELPVAPHTKRDDRPSDIKIAKIYIPHPEVPVATLSQEDPAEPKEAQASAEPEPQPVRKSDPVDVRFPTIDPEIAPLVVTHRPPEAAGIPEETLQVLHDLLTSAKAKSLSNTQGLTHEPLEDTRDNFDTDDPTIVLGASFGAQPTEPIEDDEVTQELFLGPILAASKGEDFPPGALELIHGAEKHQKEGRIPETCIAYALAAQIYVDNHLLEAAEALYRQILNLDPNHAIAKVKLEHILSPPPPSANEPCLGRKPADEFVLEFVDEPGRQTKFNSSSVDDLTLDEPSSLKAPPPKTPHGEETMMTLGILHPTRLVPDSGKAQDAQALVQLFLRARAQRATGVLRFGQNTGLLLAHGMPSGLVGDAVMPSFVRLIADIGRITESQAHELALAPYHSPRALAKKLASRNIIEDREALLLPARHLEDGLIRFLQQRGVWKFYPANGDLGTDDLVPRVRELRQWLVELLPRAVPQVELDRALNLQGATIRIVPGTEHFVSDIDTPILALLDGKRRLEEAARLSGVAIERALAWAIVWLEEGLAERIHNSVDPGLSPTHALGQREPTIFDLPRLLRPSRSRSWPSTVLNRSPKKPLNSPSKPSPTPAKKQNSRAPQKSETKTNASMPSSEPHAAPPSENSSNTKTTAVNRARMLAELSSHERVHALAEMVRTQDYFGILDIDTSANRKAISDAHQRIRSLVPDDLGGDLELMVREVLRSVDEARDVLMIPELRAAYEHHLEPRMDSSP